MTHVSQVRRIAARPAIVFDALVTAEGIGSWWGPDDFPVVSAVADPQVGGSFRVRFRTADGLEHECAGEFLEIEKPKRVVMSWRWILGGLVEEHGRVSRVEIRLRPIEIGTELTLIHGGLRSEESVRSHEAGWDGALKKLIQRFPRNIDASSTRSQVAKPERSTIMRAMRSRIGCGGGARPVALSIVTAVTCWSQPVWAGPEPYPTMAPVSQYLIASRAEEISLAKSAAPAAVADHAEVRVLGAHGYETAVKGTNGFVCFVGRSWDVSFVDPQFWNPKIRSPQCDNATSARSVLPRYLTRTEWVLAGVAKAEIQKREAAEWAAGTLKAPEPGAICYMMSKGGYLNDTDGPWRPHVMVFAPRTDDVAWGANLPGSPVASDSASYEHTTIFFIVVPNWSDRTPGPLLHK